MRNTLAALMLAMPLFAVSVLAVDAPAPAPKPDHAKKCAELRATYDKDIKHPLLKFRAHNALAEMKKLGCELPPAPTPPKK